MNEVISKENTKGYLNTVGSMLVTVLGCENLSELMPKGEAERKEAYYNMGAFLATIEANSVGTLKEIQCNPVLTAQFAQRFYELAKQSKWTFKYCYCFLQNTSDKDTDGKKTGNKHKILRMGVQYQVEEKAIREMGYDFEIKYITDKTTIKTKSYVDREHGKIVRLSEIEGGEDFLLSEAPDKISDKVNQSFVEDKVGSLYKQIKYIVVLLAKEPFELKISKNELHSSLNATFYSWDNSYKQAYKMRNGAKAVFDIAIIHLMYKKLVLGSFEDDDEIGEVEVLNASKKADVDEHKSIWDDLKEADQVETGEGVQQQEVEERAPAEPQPTEIKEAEQADNQANAVEQQQSEPTEAVVDKPVEESWLSKHCKHIDAHANDLSCLHKLLEKYEALPAKSERYSEDDRKKAIDKVQALIKAKQTSTAKQAGANEKEGMF